MEKQIRPPHRFGGDVVDLKNLLVDHVPDILHGFGAMFGFDPRRVPRKDKEEFRRRIFRGFGPMLPFLAIEAHQAGQISDAKFEYVKIEAFMRAQLAAAGRHVPLEKDACEYVLEVSRKAANPYLEGKSRLKSYREAKNGIDLFAERLVGALFERIEDIHASWLKSKETQKYMAFARGWMNDTIDFPEPLPIRFSEKTIERIANTYRSFAGFWESRLRLIVALQRAVSGESGLPETVQKAPLGHLLESAGSDPALSGLVSRLNRNVRNALAHGRPNWDRAKGLVIFHDRNQDVEWTPHEFWCQTRHLVIGGIALASFDAVLQWKIRWLYFNAFWSGLAEEERRAASS
ncbi:MAG: hypothetical protein KDB68_14825 [Planctomycetes bacterium]|nr:hypothetical protein [Planctomycetota bacterium]